jgi:hypothetical protein
LTLALQMQVKDMVVTWDLELVINRTKKVKNQKRKIEALCKKSLGNYGFI